MPNDQKKQQMERELLRERLRRAVEGLNKSIENLGKLKAKKFKPNEAA